MPHLESIATSSSTLATSPPLETFNPFATHPFTNFSAPNTLKPPSSNSDTILPSTIDIKSPQPLRDAPTNPPTRSPIFVPFRQDKSSPELSDLLKKKSISSRSQKKWTTVSLLTTYFSTEYWCGLFLASHCISFTSFGRLMGTFWGHAVFIRLRFHPSNIHKEIMTHTQTHPVHEYSCWIP